MFEDLFTSPVRSSSGARITENEDSFDWSVDMPGIDRENIDVKIDENDTLHVSTSYENSDSTHRRSYSYSVRLGSRIDTEEIEAEYENGVLTVNLPKRDPQENVREIDIS
jgi:HSP20 family protein